MSQELLVIVDDEEELLDLFEYNFKRHGFLVKVFNRALPAWEFIANNKPDMILCDWMMPGMNGLEFCRRLKSDISLADIPFVMVTCRNGQEALNVARAEGVTDYITKPVGIQELIKRVKALLDNRSRRQMLPL